MLWAVARRRRVDRLPSLTHCLPALEAEWRLLPIVTWALGRLGASAKFEILEHRLRSTPEWATHARVAGWCLRRLASSPPLSGPPPQARSRCRVRLGLAQTLSVPSTGYFRTGGPRYSSSTYFMKLSPKRVTSPLSSSLNASRESTPECLYIDAYIWRLRCTTN